MPAERIVRKLTAILAADVAGYSWLTGRDEEGTHVRLTGHLRALVIPKIAEHHGRVVKNTGDGLLAEFASVVDAVRCAAEAQRGMSERNSSAPSNERMEFRMGINVGDVISDTGDIFGDGVNVAARLEGLAEPGGICVSGRVYEDANGKLDDVTFEDMGEQQLKNIARQVRVYRARLSGQSAVMASLPISTSHKPSIAVLPFLNMSGDLEQEYFADGVVEDVITALSRFKSLFVIGRNTSFTYKGRAVDAKQVGRELGVRYLLEGSIRKSANRLRITGQLIEAATSNDLWAEKFDGEVGDIFDLQDKIAQTVVASIAPRLEQAEIARAKQKPTEVPDSYDTYLRGMASFYKGANSEARDLFRRAIKLDPEHAAAYAMAAWTLLKELGEEGALTAEKQLEAIHLANEALGSTTDDAFAMARAGHVLAYVGHQYDRGASIIEHAILLNPNLASAWFSRGFAALMCGEAERGSESFDVVLKLSPLDPLCRFAWYGKSFSLFHLRRYSEGLDYAKKALQSVRSVHSLCACILNHVGANQMNEAKCHVAALLEHQNDFTVEHALQTFPTGSKLYRDQIASAFERAGLPLRSFLVR